MNILLDSKVGISLFTLNEIPYDKSFNLKDIKLRILGANN
jgi:hypothetical protein